MNYLSLGSMKLESGWRDRMAWRLANAIIKAIATKWYAERLEQCYRLGLAAMESGLVRITKSPGRGEGGA